MPFLLTKHPSDGGGLSRLTLTDHTTTVRAKAVIDFLIERKPMPRCLLRGGGSSSRLGKRKAEGSFCQNLHTDPIFAKQKALLRLT